jgi:putative peptidoglycan lipid II flippase
VFIQLLVVAVSAACAITAYAILPVEWKTVGIAVSYGIGYWLGFLASFAVLRRRIGGADGRRLASTYARAGAAALFAGAGAYGVARLVSGALDGGAVGSAAAVVAGGALLGGVYLVLAWLFRVREIAELVELVRGRLGRSRA